MARRDAAFSATVRPFPQDRRLDETTATHPSLDAQGLDLSLEFRAIRTD